MKKFLAFLLVSVLFACNTKPDDTIHNQKSEPGGWAMDGSSDKPVQQYEIYYQISPTWGQAVAWADQRADRILTVSLAIICLALFIGLIIGKATYASWFPRYLDEKVLIYNALLFITLSASAYFYIGDASGVKWNNDKWVSKEVYDKAIKEAGSTKPIWDSLQNNCLIVDGPYNCYKK
jgi:hypothetical protein